MENFVETPKLVERHFGYYLAFSEIYEPVKVGVVAEAEAAAIELFIAMIQAWRRNLDGGRQASV